MCDHNIGGHCCHSHKADDSPSFSLYKFIDTLNVECLNESIPGSGKRVFKPYEERKDSTVYVESDVDQELLFNVPFTGSVKLMSIIISGVDNENHPSQVSLYKNKPYMTFEDLDAECDQSLELTIDPNGETLSLHISANYGGDTTRIHYIGLRGDYTPAPRREVVITNYEVTPNIADLKDTVLQTQKSINGVIRTMNRSSNLVRNISQLLSPLITEDELKHLEKLPREALSSKSSHQDVTAFCLLKNAEDEVLRLFHKKEYFRKAYNDTLERMNTLANSLPSYALDYITTPGCHENLHNKDDDHDEEEDIPLDPDYVNFMKKTIRHRQIRDNNNESTSIDIQSMLKAPPRKINKSTDIQTIDAQIEMLEASLLHYYEFVSPCRDSPVWPILPLKRTL
ncbi:PITH domain-containing protein 1 [Schistosoma japonicum]|nr:PITH domain-containing protein 1 [Schistosoma japonicum]